MEASPSIAITSALDGPPCRPARCPFTRQPAMISSTAAGPPGDRGVGIGHGALGDVQDAPSGPTVRSSVRWVLRIRSCAAQDHQTACHARAPSRAGTSARDCVRRHRRSRPGNSPPLAWLDRHQLAGHAGQWIQAPGRRSPWRRGLRWRQGRQIKRTQRMRVLSAMNNPLRSPANTEMAASYGENGRPRIRTSFRLKT